MLIVYILVALLAILGIIILSGKGDNLIAGYNMASKKEKEKYYVKRLRLIFGLLLILLAPACFLLTMEDTLSGQISFFVIVIVLITVSLILANTWAKKKRS
ncbi:MAG: DUF3784 domain-containing protein [Bacteroidales bacterium]|nr:DUF3784 domain-containing protein [Bacteroidales bacterium]